MLDTGAGCAAASLTHAGFAVEALRASLKGTWIHAPATAWVTGAGCAGAALRANLSGTLVDAGERPRELRCAQ